MRVLERTSIEADFNGVDMRGEVLLLTRNIVIAGEDILRVINNVATGITFAGFIAPGDDCGTYEAGNSAETSVFYNNTGHSTAGTLGGYGALIYPSAGGNNHKNCYEAAWFTGYKNYYLGAFGFFNTK
jgi:hypothetical protein